MHVALIHCTYGTNCPTSIFEPSGIFCLPVVFLGIFIIVGKAPTINICLATEKASLIRQPRWWRLCAYNERAMRE